MFFKLLSTFLIIQIISFALWQGVQARPSWDTKITENTHQVAVSKSEHVRFMARNNQSGPIIGSDQKDKISTVLEKLPQKHIDHLKNLVLDYNPKAHRGLGGKNLVILRAINIEIAEFFSVMIHEIGHNVDLGGMSERNQVFVSEFKDGKNPIYEGDPSLDFYRISWKNENVRQKTASNEDFVSGYAMSDPFEDFAESYVYYVLHNKEFRSKAETNDTLLEKYYFMKNNVFDGEEFNTGQYTNSGLHTRPWDITKLNYSLDQFLES